MSNSIDFVVYSSLLYSYLSDCFIPCQILQHICIQQHMFAFVYTQLLFNCPYLYSLIFAFGGNAFTAFLLHKVSKLL